MPTITNESFAQRIDDLLDVTTSSVASTGGGCYALHVESRDVPGESLWIVGGDSRLPFADDGTLVGPVYVEHEDGAGTARPLWECTRDELAAHVESWGAQGAAERVADELLRAIASWLQVHDLDIHVGTCDRCGSVFAYSVAALCDCSEDDVDSALVCGECCTCGDELVPTIACEVCGAAAGARGTDACTSDESTRYGEVV